MLRWLQLSKRQILLFLSGALSFLRSFTHEAIVETVAQHLLAELNEDLEPSFQAIGNQFETPEEINDSPINAPSKRILRIMPEYQKPFLGTLAILEIGLELIRAECPHFGQWLERIQQIPAHA